MVETLQCNVCTKNMVETFCWVETRLIASVRNSFGFWLLRSRTALCLHRIFRIKRWTGFFVTTIPKILKSRNPVLTFLVVERSRNALSPNKIFRIKIWTGFFITTILKILKSRNPVLTFFVGCRDVPIEHLYYISVMQTITSNTIKDNFNQLKFNHQNYV